jgi:citrate synthase
MTSQNVSPEPLNGLEGVVVAETQLSRVDGANGRLVVRGVDLEEVAFRLGFEGVSTLLWTGEAHGERDAPELREAARQLGAARVRAFEQLAGLGDALEAADGMEALRAALAHLRVDADDDPALERVRIAGAVAVFAAAWARRQRLARRGRAAPPSEPIAPDPSRCHADDYLHMLTGEDAHPQIVRALDAYLATVAEHGMNASTFAARVVASTGSDAVSAIVAAICALKGPLHGGAPGPVLDMLEAVGADSHARAWLESELEAGNRIMGLGHRVYRVRDPRAAVLERATLELERHGITTRRLELARAVEREAQALLKERYPDRPLAANVEFYTAVLLDTLGLDRRLFSPTFAVGRVAGWMAHVAEQRATGRLIRPACRYIGPMPEAA